MALKTVTAPARKWILRSTFEEVDNDGVQVKEIVPNRNTKVK